jgi:PPM family protein phosphatase
VRHQLIGYSRVLTSFNHAGILASGRRNSEDRAVVIERGDALVVVVADGAGGMGGGAAAADTLLLAITTALADEAFDVEQKFDLMNVLSAVDAKLAKTMVGETTCVVVVASSRGVRGMSVGDSQAWVIGANHVDDLTMGQNKKRLGSGRAVPLLFSRPRLDGSLVVGTDGLFNYTTVEMIADAVRGREPAEAVELLRALVQLPSGVYQDDVGVVVIGRRSPAETRPGEYLGDDAGD